MATPVTMPQLGESITEGTISRWLKQEGEWVKRDEPLVEIITDKVTAEMPSPTEGKLSKIIAAAGAVVPVGQLLAEIDEAGAQIGARISTPGEQVLGVSDVSSAVKAAVEQASELVEMARKRSSPLVRRLAREHGVDISQIRGTGIEGRVTKDDILTFIANRQSTPAASPAQAAILRPAEPVVAQPKQQIAPEISKPVSLAEGDQAIDLTPMRRAIAEHMVRSKRTSPHAWTTFEVDMTNIVKWREGVKEEFKRREGVPLTYVPFVVKATVDALKAFPMLNSSWVDDKIIIKKHINIGIAVAIDDGLIVPVIHDADEKSIAGLAKAVWELGNRAKAGKLTLPEVQGGTFTVNNTGSFGSIVSVPIINQPQAAILSMEAIVKRPVVVDDAIAIRPMMNLCLSFDHRIVDGYRAGKFLQHMKQWLGSFGPSVPLY
ncbi:MAG: 2-oxo acid dehydrogenase subunit E2 [Chloroflexi bacterium]|nr:2-oxo acid dehydrogenase subunit E2 [Chloroflexota bacterium]